MKEKGQLLSFVIPCYRSEKTIGMVIDEIINTVQQKTEYDYEIICVNDCSPDNIFSVLERLAAQNPRVRVVDFAKNMGKHAALLAGMSFCKGDIIITLDDDYQCPANELWRLIAPIENKEADLTTACYIQKKQNVLKNFGSRINMAMSHIMLGKPRELRFENFLAMRRFVKDEIVKYNRPYPYLEGLILRTTRKIAEVEMQERERGDNNATGFTFRKSLSLWMNGFTAFSVVPLRISTIVGALLSVIGFIVGIIIVIQKIINPDVLAGYTSMMALMLIIGGVVMLLLGIIGEYIGRIYICINNSPQYVIRETINIESKKCDRDEECLK